MGLEHFIGRGFLGYQPGFVNRLSRKRLLVITDTKLLHSCKNMALNSVQFTLLLVPEMLKQ